MRRPVMAFLFLLVGVLGVWLWANVREARQFKLPVNKEELAKELPEAPQTLAAASRVSTTTVLEAPRFTDRSEDGTAYTVQATRADQAGTVSASILVLHDVEASYTTPKEEAPFSATARTGSYNQDAKTLLLTKAKLTHDGDVLETPSATLFLDTRTAVGGKLTLTAPWGEKDGKRGTAVLTADAFDLDQRAGRATLRGHVKAVLP